MSADQAKKVKKPARKWGFVCHPHPGLPVRSSLALILTGLAPVTMAVACLALVLAFLVPLAPTLALVLAPPGLLFPARIVHTPEYGHRCFQWGFRSGALVAAWAFGTSKPAGRNYSLLFIGNPIQ